MVLKRIEIFGFKSFADRSKIDFSEGISALLGPNGCGKSNVVDAIKWTLGEQAPRQLRANKMEDLIFSGTDSRKSLSVAEAEMVLSNEDGSFPLDASEISIKRRLYRSGESEYYVNNRSIRLKELRELFFDTGIGKSAYSIMEQGRIDQILSNKPEDRRYIFEEAAGITKYKSQGREAERKLKNTEENMRQVESVLSEVERNYKLLHKQAEKTKKYRELKDLIFQEEVSIQLLRLKKLLENQNSVNEKLKKETAERDNLKEKIDGINENVEKNFDVINSMESDMIEKQKHLYGIDIEKNNCENQIKTLRERKEELERNKKSIADRKERSEKRKTELNEEWEQKKADLEEYGERIKETEENIHDFEQSIQSTSGRIKDNDSLIEQKENDNQENEEERTQLQSELRELTDAIVFQLDKQLKESGYSSKQRKEKEEEIENILGSMQILIRGKQQIIGDMHNASHYSEKHVNDMVEKVGETFSSFSGYTEQLKDIFEEYKIAIPRFIDDFVAPEGTITRKRTIEERTQELLTTYSENKKTIQQKREENKNLNAKLDEYKGTLEKMKINLVRLNTQKSALEDNFKTIESNIKEQDEIVRSLNLELEENEQTLQSMDKKIADEKEKKADIEKREEKIRKEISELEGTINEKNKTIKEEEGNLKRMMDDLGKKQKRVEQLQMDESSIETEIKGIYSNFEDRYSKSLEEYDGQMYDIRESLQDIKGRLSDLKEQLRQLGQVNLMAPEEFEEVKERYEFLENQLSDLRTAREDLKEVTRTIKEESESRFMRTYDLIKKNFHSMFRRLFGGGRAELRLTDEENLLESGVDILAQPPGKKLESIALLSGGERSLTAIALLFATYMVKPSPFCILDEIDAALDDQNVGRFINMLMEFSKTSQFIIITHNKKTAVGANTLLGVTMEESGVSEIMSIRVGETVEA